MFYAGGEEKSEGRERVAQGNAIDHVVRPYVQAGGLTHYYAAHGTLSKGILQRSLFLPGGRSYFDLSSLTKALVITPLLCWMTKELLLSGLEIAPFAEAGAEYAALSLLQHEAGLPFWCNLWISNLKACRGQRATALMRLEAYLRERPRLSPSTSSPYLYGDLGHILLSLWLERQAGIPLEQLYSDFLEKVLQVEPDLLFYRPTEAQKKKCIPTAYCHVRKRWLCGEVHDENASALGGISGHAGLFGSGSALEDFLIHFLSSHHGKPFSADMLPPYDASRRSFLGWQIGMGLQGLQSRTSWIMGHQGFTGTLFWWMPETACFGLLLTNRTMGGRRVPWIQGLRQKVFSLQCQDLGV